MHEAVIVVNFQALSCGSRKLTEKAEKLWTNLAWWTPDIKRWM